MASAGWRKMLVSEGVWEALSVEVLIHDTSGYEARQNESGDDTDLSMACLRLLYA